MIKEFSMMGIGLVTVYSLYKFVNGFINKEKNIREEAMRDLYKGMDSINKEDPQVRIYALLYGKIHLYYRQVSLDYIQKKPRSLHPFKEEARRYCLEFAPYLSKDVGEKGLKLIESMASKTSGNRLKSLPPSLAQATLRSLYQQILNLRFSMRQEIGTKEMNSQRKTSHVLNIS